MLEISPEILIDESEIHLEFMQSSGPGGQNVNKVNTAVELTHVPTGIVVRCREERSQVQNKEKALIIFKNICLPWPGSLPQDHLGSS